MGYLVAFNRDRDHYQVPVALAEQGLLSGLVTDYYAGATWPRVPALAHRSDPALPPELVTTAYRSLAIQAVQQAAVRLGLKVPHPARLSDDLIADRTRRLLRHDPSSDLFLYSGLAGRIYRQEPGRFRALFQYHPSPRLVRAAMLDDDLLKDADWLPEPEEARSAWKERIHDEELEHSDLFFCASSFTRRGLLEEGVPPARVRVAPYGCAPVSSPQTFPDEQAPAVPTFLFVGQGVRRKGLHLLLAAWEAAALRSARLRIIASRIDPAIAARAARSPNVELSGAVSAAGLRSAMSTADTLVLPSLVEGFGLVIGEALGSGLRVIASTNTGLVDYGVPAPAGRIVAAGRVHDLREALVEFAENFDRSRPYRSAALESARRNDWARFRSGIRAGLPTAERN